MENYYKCSYVITYIHSKRNLNLLKHSINQLLIEPRVEIIVVEAGKHSMLGNMDLKCKYVFAETDRYNVGWLFNLGARKATTNKLFFAEHCIFPKMDFVMSILKKPTDHDCIYGQSEIIELTQEQTDSKQYNYDLPSVSDSIGGLYYYTFEGLYKVGMWDENLYGRDLYVLQDKKNNLFLKLGKAEDTKSIKFMLDKSEIADTLIEGSKNHLDKVTTQDQNKILGYIRSQVKKSSNIHKYVQPELMKP